MKYKDLITLLNVITEKSEEEEIHFVFKNKEIEINNCCITPDRQCSVNFKKKAKVKSNANTVIRR